MPAPIQALKGANNPLRRILSDRKSGFRIFGGDNRRARTLLERGGGTFGRHDCPYKSAYEGYVSFGDVGNSCNKELASVVTELDTINLGSLAIETGAPALRFPKGVIISHQPYDGEAEHWYDGFATRLGWARATILLTIIPPESIERALAGEKESDNPGHRLDPRVLGVTLNINASRRDAYELARLPADSFRACLENLFEDPPTGETGRAIAWIHEGFIKPAPNGLDSFELADPYRADWGADIKRRLYT